ncbi:MAG: HEAT repeat domain-containing protein [Acidimicrobiia bacterium]|nr:HEAT repeat domain-containing protein [Acidimicrobiia bacterium]NNC74759.1 hypothetical protein [Acidimicrobiia bacterium]
MADLSTELEQLLDNPMGALDHGDPAVRRLAVSALAGTMHDPAVFSAVSALTRDDDAERVRAEATEAVGRCGAGLVDEALGLLEAVRTDPSTLVVEAAATAYGELADSRPLPWLIELATGDGDSMAREAAVAALGAIGDDAAIPELITLAASGPPQVRRRAMVALSVFEGPEVEAAVRAGLEDRNPMVREAAEMVVGETLRHQRG